MDNQHRMVALVNKRGRVVWAHPWEVELLRRQGSRVIVNPKEDYYPQYDQELANATALSDQLVENVEPSDILDGEDI